jgi:hypothetical protein
MRFWSLVLAPLLNVATEFEPETELSSLRILYEFSGSPFKYTQFRVKSQVLLLGEGQTFLIFSTPLMEDKFFNSLTPIDLETNLKFSLYFVGKLKTEVLNS